MKRLIALAIVAVVAIAAQAVAIFAGEGKI
jgi:hypothetical protein